jgi:predicted signal transduction protein with EAL and GGDEF domain
MHAGFGKRPGETEQPQGCHHAPGRLSPPEDLAIVRAIIGLAEAFGLELVAEGVQTEVAAATLMRYGCHRAQGFLLSRPVAGDDMESLLSRRWMPTPFHREREALSGI